MRDVSRSFVESCCRLRQRVGLPVLITACLSIPALRVCAEAAAPGAAPVEDELRASRATLERILTQNIIPFWFSQTIDRENGGYLLNHDTQGKYLGPAPRFLVTQARQVWFFSRLARSPYGKPEYVEAARHGFVFLRDHMWDAQNGGFFWEVDAKGNTAIQPHKHLYGQAFALYALSEYAIATHDVEAEALARQLFALMESRAHDGQYGGYREFFSREWGPVPAGSGTYMGVGHSDTKLMNTHLHLMEALTTYYRLTRQPLARERLLELVLIETNTVVRKGIAACTDEYGRDWTPRRPERVSYGHDIENVWLVLDALDALGVPQAPLVDLARALVDDALQYGFDRDHGGFYSSGRLGQPADRKEKVWWVEAEGLVATLTLFRLTGDVRYRDAYLQTLKWVENGQIDWRHGDWHDTVLADGSVVGLKAGPWKGAYHDGRAMLRCLELLDDMPGLRDAPAHP
jgi:mannose/cellobiose epimerase-like protein (N-acyl-D-glucosamine 2-epimerase family)